jgi:ABC-type transport system involved in cytochrome c biogenesis permease subunit
MIPSGEEKRNTRPPEIPVSKFASIGAEVGCLTVLIVLAAVFGGIWLDKLLGTKPVLTILFVVGSAPLSIGITMWLALREVREAKTPKKPSAAEETRKEEDPR